MADPKGDYRFSALAVILIGFVALVVGVVSSIFGRGTSFGTVLSLAWTLGLVLLVIGIVRAVRERDARQKLADHAARAVIGQAAGAAGSVSAELHRLTELHTSGALSDDEFNLAKAKVLGN